MRENNYMISKTLICRFGNTLRRLMLVTALLIAHVATSLALTTNETFDEGGGTLQGSKG